MTVIKLYDAVVLINILQDIEFEDIIIDWAKNPRYEQWTTHEVNLEVKKDARHKLDKLIKDKDIEVTNQAPQQDLKQIQGFNPKFSLADCSLIYHYNKLSNAICLTNDLHLRKYFIRNNLNLSGTNGIYLKLIKEGNLPKDKVEEKFKALKKDSRVFPHP
ncbi:MAG: hypothetical protein EU533_07030 [Promethearchaeota archaeon]|nr:MAG: hypothetical protein EU533_07030 [Candidatus Lokiarchaeota archaeon]